MDFAHKLRAARQDRHLSLDGLSQALNNRYDTNISKSMLSRWEHGTDLQMSYVRILADYFGLSAAEILGEGASNQADINRVYQQLDSVNQARILSVAKTTLAQQEAVSKRQLGPQQVLVYGSVSAGTGEYLSDAKPEAETYLGRVPAHDYAVTVNGNSMAPLFTDGQIIFVRQTDQVHSGQIVIADYDHQAFVKKYIHDQNGRRLVSLNPNYPDLSIDRNHEITIMGAVVL
ncbi:XRE family transcriptional regulator [Lactobacillaceae bacterium L1_55_11]|nr:XRE family transcriptional regulator [Lactobacillaceae bacterium L1_55_11]